MFSTLCFEREALRNSGINAEALVGYQPTVVEFVSSKLLWKKVWENGREG